MDETGKRPSHPTDSVGLPLPDASWPDEPGSAGGLEPLRRFCNTVNREAGADAWRTPEELAGWLRRDGHGDRAIDAADLASARAWRDACFLAIRDRTLTALEPLLHRLPVAMGVDVDGRVSVRARRTGIDDVLVVLTGAIADAQRDGSWTRLKACAHCAWVFHDPSKNRSGRWCSMAACGGREKAKAYRRRHVALGAVAAHVPYDG
jgi:predicted RNA-binding Zn ribbon-like protein